MKNTIGPNVKQIWNGPMHRMSAIFLYFTNATDYSLLADLVPASHSRAELNGGDVEIIVGVRVRVHVAHVRICKQCDQILLNFGQLFKAGGNNYFAQITHIVRQFLYRYQNRSFFQ